MGLREQLLKAGLVNKKQVKQVEATQKKQVHGVLKNKENALKTEQIKAEELAKIEIERLNKFEKDKKLNEQIEILRQEKDKFYRTKLLIKSSNMFDFKNDITYYFLENNQNIRSLKVSQYQQEMLARGKFAITRSNMLPPDHLNIITNFANDEDEFIIIPSYIANIIKNITPYWFIMQHNKVDDDKDIIEIVMQEYEQKDK